MTKGVAMAWAGLGQRIGFDIMLSPHHCVRPQPLICYRSAF